MDGPHWSMALQLRPASRISAIFVSPLPSRGDASLQLGDQSIEKGEGVLHDWSSQNCGFGRVAWRARRCEGTLGGQIRRFLHLEPPTWRSRGERRTRWRSRSGLPQRRSLHTEDRHATLIRLRPVPGRPTGAAGRRQGVRSRPQRPTWRRGSPSSVRGSRGPRPSWSTRRSAASATRRRLRRRPYAPLDQDATDRIFGNCHERPSVRPSHAHHNLNYSSRELEWYLSNASLEVSSPQTLTINFSQWSSQNLAVG